MAARPFRLTRPALFSARELERIEGAALRILEQVGIGVAHPELAARAKRQGFRLEGGRVRLARGQVARFLEEARGGKPAPRRQPAPKETEPARLTMGVSIYPQSVHDPATDQVAPFTAARLVEATKLVDMLGERGLQPGVPGCPVDVPPALQVVRQYRIGAENLRGWRGPVDAKALESLPYVMEMSEALGQPLRGLPVYVFSPLKLAGESLSAVMALEERLHSVHVGSMPAAGATAPVRPAEAFASATAEVVGSALILGECIKPEVHWSVGVDPFDLRGMAMSFGSPESLLFQMASSEVNAYLHGRPWWPAAGNVHTLAKLPGEQAAAEKASIMTVGALLGARGFGSAGTLSLDEVFSPVQLLVDLEIKDHVERLLRGLDTALDVEACVQDVQEGVGRGFVGLDRTLDQYQRAYWHPRLFERRFLGPWQAASCPTLSRQAQQMAQELVARHDYELAPDLRAEIERIYRRAERELAGRR